MSLESKYKGICKDCKKKFTKGTMIGTNSNDNWCADGMNCSAITAVDIPKPTQQKPLDTSNLKSFISSQYDDIHTIEKSLLILNDDFKTNGSRLGMYINNINTAWQKKKEAS